MIKGAILLTLKQIQSVQTIENYPPLKKNQNKLVRNYLNYDFTKPFKERLLKNYIPNDLIKKNKKSLTSNCNSLLQNYSCGKTGIQHVYYSNILKLEAISTRFFKS